LSCQFALASHYQTPARALVERLGDSHCEVDLQHAAILDAHLPANAVFAGASSTQMPANAWNPGALKLDPVLKPEEAQRPYTVTELANEIRRELRPLTALLLKGEVSGMKKGTKGHYTFVIRDSQSLINAFLFADDARRVSMLPEDGQVFIFRGRVDYWTQYGALRFVVDQVEFDDVGKLRARLEELKRRLEMEGAFDARRKRKLPFLPQTVALLTSPTGAVINDLQETIWDRYPNMAIVVYPVQVQGAGAPMSVARALRRCNAEKLADVIVLARGGGSFEEMYAFNTELVARAILDSKLPVVTALGHTSDRTVADLVGDAECRTPTEAGARVVPKKSDLQTQLGDRRRRLDRELKQRLQRYAERIERASRELQRLSPVAQVARREDALRERNRRLDAAAAARLSKSTHALTSRRAQQRLERALAEKFAGATRAIAHRRERLNALSPDAVLLRGYSITQDAGSGAVIRSATATAKNRQVRIRLAEGSLGARVEEVEP
jgi:exodeoxyribonuclease VII large subunit